MFEGSRRYLGRRARPDCAERWCRRAPTPHDVLDVTGLAQYVELRVDGVTIREEELAGKPAPDTFLAAAKRLGVDPAAAAVFEDAIAGVQAGRAGRLRRTSSGSTASGRPTRCKSHGADVVVSDLAELLGGAT